MVFPTLAKGEKTKVGKMVTPNNSEQDLKNALKAVKASGAKHFSMYSAACLFIDYEYDRLLKVSLSIRNAIQSSYILRLYFS